MHSTIWRKLTAVLSVWLMVVAPTIVGCAVPRPPPDGDDGPVFVESGDPDSDVAGFLEGSAGNVFAVLGEKDSQGSTTRVTGAYYEAADGSSWTVFLGDSGLPDRLVVGDWVFVFNNYAGDTVDLTAIAPDGTTETVGGISLNGEFLGVLRDAASAGETGRALTGKARTLASAKGNLPTAKMGFSDLLQIGNALLGLATCAVSIGVSAGITAGSAFLATPAGVALTIVGCSGAVVSTINLFVDDEGLSASSTTISTVTCVASAFTQCGGLINDIGIRIIDDLETADNSETKPDGGECADGWQEYRSHCYKLTAALGSWDDAEAEAVAAGGHLATINDEDENQWILDTFDPLEPRLWIGLHQLSGSIEPDGGWVWSSGEPVTYTNWRATEPNNNGDEKYAEFMTSSAFAPGKWNDRSDGHPYLGIIEIP